MKHVFLLIAVCITTHLSFGQDRSDGLTRLTNNRDDARIIQRNVVRNVNRQVYRNIRYDGWVNGYDFRHLGRSIRSQARGGAYYDTRSTRYQVRDQIRSEMRHVHNVIRNCVRSGFRWMH